MNRIARSIAEGRRPPLRIAAIYLLVGATWIVVTDLALGRLVSDPRRAALLQTAKGWTFVLLSAALVYLLARAVQRAIIRDRDVTPVRTAEDTAELALERVREADARLHVALEKERRALAMDIHDEIGGALAGIRMQLRRLSAGDRSESGWEDRLHRIEEDLAEVAGSVRRLSRRMSPPVLEELGLIPALRSLVEDLDRTNGLTVTLELPEAGTVDVTRQRAIHVYRIVQEAVTNSLKHARPERIRLTVEAEAGEVRIQLRDDGKGFDPGTSDPGPHGLSNMRARAEAAEGRLEVESEPGEGTVVTVRVPSGPAPVGR